MLRAVILSGLLVAILAAPAAASSGNGLYKPFPSAVGNRSARTYYARIGRKPTEAELVSGVFRQGFAAAAPDGPSERAGETRGLGIWEVLAAAAVALAAAGIAAARRARG